jgi:hypothetical protein
MLPRGLSQRCRIMVVDAVNSLTQRLRRKSLGFRLRDPSKRAISSFMMAPPSDSGATWAAMRRSAWTRRAKDGFEFGGSIDHGVSFGESGAYWGIIALRAKSSVGVRFALCRVSSSVQPRRPSSAGRPPRRCPPALARNVKVDGYCIGRARR